MFNRQTYKYSTFLIVIFVQIILLSSCTEGDSKQKISEGEIEYEIEYLDDERENPLISLLPRKMIMVFKDGYIHSQTEGFFGTFKLISITNPVEGQNFTLFQILDKKYMYLADTSIAPFGYKYGSNLEISYTEDIKKIAGYDCKVANVIFPNSIDTIEVFYTRDIDIKKPNLNNPYKSINGVLLQFSVKLAGINMKLKAKNVIPRKINPEKFNIPAGFKEVSKDEMERIVNEYNQVIDK